jgi:quaternary ammonium compound-resistance protein SugE
MAWLALFGACVFEVTWMVGMKYSAGLTRLWPTVFTLVTSLCSFVLLAQAVRTLDIGPSYAIWTGIGTAGAVIFGAILFGESLNPLRILFVTLIIVGVAGLHFTLTE